MMGMEQEELAQLVDGVFRLPLIAVFDGELIQEVRGFRGHPCHARQDARWRGKDRWRTTERGRQRGGQHPHTAGCVSHRSDRDHCGFLIVDCEIESLDTLNSKFAIFNSQCAARSTGDQPPASTRILLSRPRAPTATFQNQPFGSQHWAYKKSLTTRSKAALASS